ELADTSSRRQRLERRARQRRLLPDVLQVHDGRFARDGDRFSELADLQVGVDRGGEAGAQLEPLTLQRAEPGEREGHGIGARTQINYPVESLAVTDGGAGFLDEDRAGGFNGDAWQDRTRCVLDHPRNAAVGILRRGSGAEHEDTNRKDTQDRPAAHRIPPCNETPGGCRSRATKGKGRPTKGSPT